jgi:hypothetical protein
LPVNKGRFFLCFCLGVSLYLIPETVLWGQEEAYRVEEDGRFVQILRWKEQENILDYEVEIERRQAGGWETVLTERTGTAFCEVSLAAGTYRYRVRAYDLLERPGEAAEWVQFEVLLAEQPELLRFSPEVFYLDEKNLGAVTLWGRNLAPGLEVYLRPEGKPEDRIPADTVTVEDSGQEARVVFSPGLLRAGDYTILVVNQGGLKSSRGTFKILPGKSLDIQVSAEYTPLLLHGRLNDLFETVFFPLGFYGRLNLIPLKRDWRAPGIEFEASRYQLWIRKYSYEVHGQLAGGSIYSIYQRQFLNRRLAVTVYAGNGIYPLPAYHFFYPWGTMEPMAVLIPVISAGVSFQWITIDSVFMIGGVDFIHLFTSDASLPGYLRPFLGIGRHF